MKFTKMHGCGNDYIYVDCTQQPLPDPNGVALKLSDRHFGIGSDGLILICPSDQADFRMAMYNSDGSEGAMCGNGIRCVAKFCYDKGLTDKTTISVETKGGMKYLDLTVEDGVVTWVKVDMGAPSVQADTIPVVGMGDPVIGQPVTVGGKEWVMTCVSMGNPHGVVFCNPDSLNLEVVGPLFEHHEKFPERLNAEFIKVIDRNTLKMRVWERGSGETWACGTGACAAAVAAVENGYCDKDTDITVKLRGGELVIRYTDEAVYLTGSAETVYEGIIEI